MNRMPLAPRDESARELDFLLAEGNLAGPEYDAVEQRVMARTARPSAAARWRLPALSLAATLGGLALAFGFATGGDSPPPAFSAKGSLESAIPVGVGCAGVDPHRCRPGSTLMFAVPPGGSGYLAAFGKQVGDGQPESDGTGALFWLLPTEGGDTPKVLAEDATRVLEQGVRLEADLPAGRYAVTAWLAPNPVQRSHPAPLPPQGAGTTFLLLGGGE